ncbi:hypothetical protein N6B72_21095 [Chryseobacterium soli]|uniref:Uncharacterized protein n=1 Tax=Chryseobacterium soli TaxID=445961 RepID=A0A086A7L8_9FLAO|nr:hypothetical protein [Chryseobacterium soli]KFF12682.1 hypothetical protein IW15_07735 [Chryseobacterium soli]MDV7699424.1 hypothetical protein [Chryseobacterium soli]
MINPVIFYIKSGVYEKTQYHILERKFNKSETICFSEKDLTNAEWKEEKEFILNGFSYDVININFINGTKYFYCYLDKKDIVLNSILKFSGFFVTKKVYAWRHFDVPLQGKKLMKISNIFAFFDCEELQFFNFYLKLKSGYVKRLENTSCLSIIIPPPEEWF